MEKVPFFGFLLDKKGSCQELKYEELETVDRTDKILWVHFDYTTQQAKDWITKRCKDSVVSDALLAEDTRPRTMLLDDYVLLALRGVNLNPKSNPEKMVSIRLFVSTDMIISTSKRSLLSVYEILEDLKKGVGVKSTSEFLVKLTGKIIDRMEDMINKLEDKTDHLEENIINMKSKEFRTETLNIRRKTIVLRRYLTPQKEALIKLSSEKILWIDEYQKVEIRETNDQLTRYIEEIDSVKDRVVLIQEELANSLSEEVNKKMYILSIISAIFLPLTFLTGLLGINVGGIPGASNDKAFYIFVLLLLLVIFFQYLIFKKRKWI